MEKNPSRECVIPIHKPNRKEYVFFFVTGIVVSIPFAVFYEGLFPTGVPAILLIVVVAPFIEELAKVFPLFYRHGETERSLVSLGILIGLGFGVSEFFIYVLNGAPLLARIPGIVFHASSAGITAYGIAKKNPLPYYLLAVSLHMLNNFFAVVGDFYTVIIQALVLASAYLLSWRYYHRASKDKIVV
ncbi:MAG: PrsW family intramembrane metalloprotease [Candidatus Bathyarchaeota archaeon]|nr:PrsW family intramembrane metalloprotease [Candidatus Bathyarchaeota archaeon]